MWVLKLKLAARSQLLGALAIKHKVSMTGYPLSYYKDKESLYLVAAGILFGEEARKKELIKDAKKMKEVIELEQNGDFVITVTKQPLFSEPVYNPKIIRPRPVIINKDGFHIWELASFDKKLLEQVLEFAGKYLDGKILSFRQEKLSGIHFTKMVHDLTQKQKHAMELAVNKGYYDYPKKIKMEDLAKVMKISYATYQAHLKKAEGKLIPSIFREL